MAAPPLDIQAIQARADAVLADALYWFPVRHHFPGVARHLRDAIVRRRPKLILMEGPAHASEMVKFVVDAKTKPPVAIYCSYRDDDNVLGLAGIESPAADIPPRFSSWFPLLAYSPEYVAMCAAREVGAEVVFIDLPHHAQIAPAPKPSAAPAPEAEAPAAAEAETEAETETSGRGWEALALESSFYRKLAEVAGYRSWDECWDSLFEATDRHPDTESFRRDLAYFCASVRATCPPERIASDGTLERERHMWQAIRKELARTQLEPAKAMVVCGGFHLFMERDEATPPPPAPKGTVYVTVAPYSYFRTSELSGYGAGNRAPRYYQTLWEQTQAAARAEALPAPPAEALIETMVEHVVSVLTRGRKEGEALSSADAISVTQHARMLASLRGRRAPILDDLRDALISCCCKGRPEEEGAHLLQAMRGAEIGSAIGRVTPALGQLPLVHDFYAQLDQLDLGEVMGKEKRLKLSLDLRTDLDARRSAFFHRLVQVAVPMAALAGQSRDGGTLFKEQWTLQWSPKVEAELVERNLYGDSVEAAAVALLDEELAKEAADAGGTCERLLRAVNMDLPGMVVRMQASAGPAIDADKRLPSLARALTHLLVLDRIASHRILRRDIIGELIVRSFGRACFTLPEVVAVPDEEQAEVIAGLMSLAEALLGDKGPELDRRVFIENLKTAYQTSPVPYLKGAFSGILTEIQEQTPEALAAQVASYSRERPEVMIHAGEFIDGLMGVSKTSILLGADSLIGALDELLRAAEWEAFATMLPRIRNAFERLHERQRLSLCDRVAQRYGLREAETVATLNTSVGAALAMAALDARVAAIMKEWGL